jgi:hypothetical protein
MDLVGEPVGQFLSALPRGQRAARYRRFAVEAVLRAREAFNPDQRAEYLTMASGWHAMAVEAERYLARTIPGEDDGHEQSEAMPDDPSH